MKRAVVIAGLAILAGVMVYAVLQMPKLGDAGAPDKTYMVPRYISRGLQEAGNRSIPNDVFLNYRAFDTMGGVIGLFAAFCAAMIVLGRSAPGRSQAGPDASPVKTSVMLRTISRVLIPLTIMFAAYVSLMGVNSLGYSLQSGTLVTGVIILLTLVFSLLEISRRMLPRAQVVLESAGIGLFLLVGLLAIFFGSSFLTLSLPGFAGRGLQVERAVLMYILDISIGASLAGIVISVIFSLMREVEIDR